MVDYTFWLDSFKKTENLLTTPLENSKEKRGQATSKSFQTFCVPSAVPIIMTFSQSKTLVLSRILLDILPEENCFNGCNILFDFKENYKLFL